MIYPNDIKLKAGIVVIDGFIGKRQDKIVRFPLFKIEKYNCIVNNELSKPIFISSRGSDIIICNEGFVSYLIEKSQEVI